MRWDKIGLVAILLAAVGLFGIPGPAGGDLIQWTGNGGDWHTPGNWDGGVVPGNNDEAFILNGGTATISANATARRIGVGRQGGDIGSPAAVAGPGNLIQTSGTLTITGDRFYVGGDNNVGTYELQGGTLTHTASDTMVGRNTSGQTALSGIVQSGTSSATYKKLFIGDGWVNSHDDDSRGYYHMNGGTMVINQYGLLLADSQRKGGSLRQEADFIQTGGLVTINNNAVALGAGTGGGGHAILSLEGGLFHNKPGVFAFSQPAGNNGVYVDIAGGTLRLDDADNGGSMWGFTALTTKWANSDFRAFGSAATAGNLIFTGVDGGFTDITAIPEPHSLVLLLAGMLGLAMIRRRK
jgi:hypothetical protein